MNRYQRRKARMIAAVILAAACQAPKPTPLAWLPGLVARMDEAQWRAVSFAAGQPVASHPARVLVVAILEGLA